MHGLWDVQNCYKKKVSSTLQGAKSRKSKFIWGTLRELRAATDQTTMEGHKRREKLNHLFLMKRRTFFIFHFLPTEPVHGLFRSNSS